MDEKFSKDGEILGGKNPEMWEIKNSIKITLEIIANRLDQAEERISGTEDKIKELLNTDSNKEKIINKHDQNFQELWDSVKKSNLRIHGVEEGDEIQIYSRKFSRKFPKSRERYRHKNRTGM
jgi:hypothetical protein